MVIPSLHRGRPAAPGSQQPGQSRKQSAAATTRSKGTATVTPHVQRHVNPTPASAVVIGAAGPSDLPVVLPPDMQHLTTLQQHQQQQQQIPATVQRPRKRQPVVQARKPIVARTVPSNAPVATSSTAQPPTAAAKVVHSPIVKRVVAALPSQAAAPSTDATLPQPQQPTLDEQYQLTDMQSQQPVKVLNVFGDAQQRPARRVLAQAALEPVVTVKGGGMLQQQRRISSPVVQQRSPLRMRSKSPSSAKSILKRTAAPTSVYQASSVSASQQSLVSPVVPVASTSAIDQAEADSVQRHPRLSSPSPARDVTRHLPSPEPYHSVSAILGSTVGNYHAAKQKQLDDVDFDIDTNNSLILSPPSTHSRPINSSAVFSQINLDASPPPRQRAVYNATAYASQPDRNHRQPHTLQLTTHASMSPLASPASFNPRMQYKRPSANHLASPAPAPTTHHRTPIRASGRLHAATPSPLATRARASPLASKPTTSSNSARSSATKSSASARHTVSAEATQQRLQQLAKRASQLGLKGITPVQKSISAANDAITALDRKVDSARRHTVDAELQAINQELNALHSHTAEIEMQLSSMQRRATEQRDEIRRSATILSTVQAASRPSTGKAIRKEPASSTDALSARHAAAAVRRANAAATASQSRKSNPSPVTAPLTPVLAVSKQAKPVYAVKASPPPPSVLKYADRILTEADKNTLADKVKQLTALRSEIENSPPPTTDNFATASAPLNNLPPPPMRPIDPLEEIRRLVADRVNEISSLPLPSPSPRKQQIAHARSMTISETPLRVAKQAKASNGAKQPAAKPHSQAHQRSQSVSRAASKQQAVETLPFSSMLDRLFNNNTQADMQALQLLGPLAAQQQQQRSKLLQQAASAIQQQQSAAAQSAHSRRPSTAQAPARDQQYDELHAVVKSMKQQLEKLSSQERPAAAAQITQANQQPPAVTSKQQQHDADTQSTLTTPKRAAQAASRRTHEVAAKQTRDMSAQHDPHLAAVAEQLHSDQPTRQPEAARQQRHVTQQHHDTSLQAYDASPAAEARGRYIRQLEIEESQVAAHALESLLQYSATNNTNNSELRQSIATSITNQVNDGGVLDMVLRLYDVVNNDSQVEAEWQRLTTMEAEKQHQEDQKVKEEEALRAQLVAEKKRLAELEAAESAAVAEEAKQADRAKKVAEQQQQAVDNESKQAMQRAIELEQQRLLAEEQRRRLLTAEVESRKAQAEIALAELEVEKLRIANEHEKIKLSKQHFSETVEEAVKRRVEEELRRQKEESERIERVVESKLQQHALRQQPAATQQTQRADSDQSEHGLKQQSDDAAAKIASLEAAKKQAEYDLRHAELTNAAAKLQQEEQMMQQQQALRARQHEEQQLEWKQRQRDMQAMNEKQAQQLAEREAAENERRQLEAAKQHEMMQLLRQDVIALKQQVELAKQQPAPKPVTDDSEMLHDTSMSSVSSQDLSFSFELPSTRQQPQQESEYLDLSEGEIPSIELHHAPNAYSRVMHQHHSSMFSPGHIPVDSISQQHSSGRAAPMVNSFMQTRGAISFLPTVTTAVTAPAVHPPASTANAKVSPRKRNVRFPDAAAGQQHQQSLFYLSTDEDDILTDVSASVNDSVLEQIASHDLQQPSTTPSAQTEPAAALMTKDQATSISNIHTQLPAESTLQHLMYNPSPSPSLGEQLPSAAGLTDPPAARAADPMAQLLAGMLQRHSTALLLQGTGANAVSLPPASVVAAAGVPLNADSRFVKFTDRP